MKMRIIKRSKRASARARKVIRRGTRIRVGKFPTLKPTKRSVHWNSPLERDLFFILELDSDVKLFREQPCTIEYFLDGKKHRYTPDLLVVRSNRSQIIEVKPKSKVKKYDQLFRMVALICREHGYEFVVATDVEIRQQPRLNNLKLLWRYSRIIIYPQHQIACQNFFRMKHKATLGELFEFFAKIGVGRQVVYALLCRGIVECDLSRQRIDSNCVVRLPGMTFNE
jgi:hypothetical protein